MFERVLRSGACASFLVVLVALVVGPPAEGTPTTRFVSTEYAYEIVLSGGSARFSTSHATTNWISDQVVVGGPEFDTIFDRKTHSIYVIAARQIPPGWTLRKWTSFTVTLIAPTGGRCVYEHQTLERSKLGGAPALVYDIRCVAGASIQAAVIHNHRGYVIFDVMNYVSGRSIETFNAALHSFHFLNPERRSRP
jgi:hypothetical protein